MVRASQVWVVAAVEVLLGPSAVALSITLHTDWVQTRVLVVEVAAACSWLSLLILMQSRGLLTAGSLGALVVVVDVVLANLATRSAKPRRIEYNAAPRWMTKAQSMKH